MSDEEAFAKGLRTCLEKLKELCRTIERLEMRLPPTKWRSLKYNG